MLTIDNLDNVKEASLLKASLRLVETYQAYGNKLPKIIEENDVVMFVGKDKSRLLRSYLNVYMLLHSKAGIVKVTPSELRNCFDLLKNEG